MRIRLPRWFQPWPWLWDRRDTPRPSIEARAAADDTAQRLAQAAADAQQTDSGIERSAPVLERLAKLLDRLGGN